MANDLVVEDIMKALIKVCGLALAVASAQVSAGEKISETLSIDSATSVSIENLRGKVSIIGWEKDIVSVVGELDDKAEGFIFEKDGNDIIVKVEMPHNFNSGWGDHGSKLTINVPNDIRVDFTGVSSDVKVADLAKRTEIKTVSGDIEAREVEEHIELTSVSGNVNSHNLAGKINISTVSGDVKDKKSTGRLSLKSVSGNIYTDSKATEISLTSVSGEVDFTLAATDELVLSTVSGDIDGSLSLENDGLLKMSSVSGDIEVKFTNDVQASFRLKSNAGGDLKNGITDDRMQRAKYGPSAKLSFETGNASASVKGSTVSGRIKVSN